MIPLLPLTLAILGSMAIGAALAYLWIALDEQQRRYEGEAAEAPQENPDALMQEIAAARYQSDLCHLISRAMYLPAAAQQECLRLIELKSIELTQP